MTKFSKDYPTYEAYMIGEGLLFQQKRIPVKRQRKSLPNQIPIPGLEEVAAQHQPKMVRRKS